MITNKSHLISFLLSQQEKANEEFLQSLADCEVRSDSCQEIFKQYFQLQRCIFLKYFCRSLLTRELQEKQLNVLSEYLLPESHIDYNALKSQLENDSESPEKTRRRSKKVLLLFQL